MGSRMGGPLSWRMGCRLLAECVWGGGERGVESKLKKKICASKLQSLICNM